MSVMQEGEEGDVLARKGLADAKLTCRPDSWLRRPGGQGLKVRDGRVQEGKGRIPRGRLFGDRRVRGKLIEGPAGSTGMAN